MHLIIHPARWYWNVLEQFFPIEVIFEVLNVLVLSNIFLHGGTLCNFEDILLKSRMTMMH